MNQYEKVSHVGLDNHRKFSRLTARDGQNNVVFRQRLEHDDRLGLMKDLRRFAAGTPVILEGSFGWGWMADELTEAKLAPHLSSARKVAGWREARSMAKNNKLDADLLSELWPQTPRWWEVWLAPREVRDRRERLRYRMSLVRMQTMTKNRIHATLHRHGIVHSFSDLFGVKGREFLKALIEADEPLREAGRTTLEGHLRLLDQLRRQIASVTRIVRREVKRDESAELWRSLPGVGWVLAYTIHAEVGDAMRFPNGRHLASYSLLAPKADDSGDEDDGVPLGRHVGHMGRATLKWAFIEAARGAVRKKDPLFLGIFDRRTDKGKKDCNRGYIAVARKMAEVGLACVKKQRRYTTRPPSRPGERLCQEQMPCPQPGNDQLESSKPAEAAGKGSVKRRVKNERKLKDKSPVSSGNGPA